MNEEQKPGSVVGPSTQMHSPATESTDKVAPFIANVALEADATEPTSDQVQPGSYAPAEQDYQAKQDIPKEKADVSWTASEFIEHAKSLNWYLVLAICGIVGATLVYLLTKEVISTAAIAVVAILFGVSASVKPKVLPYEINYVGVRIGDKLYNYHDYKTFALIHDGGAFSSIQLMPLKRFSPPVSMYFPPEDESAIVSTLSQYLPYEERKADATDRLLKRIRF